MWGCLFVSVISILIVQVRGGFTVTKVPAILARRKDLKKAKKGSVDNDADTQELGSGQWLLVNPTSPTEPKAEEKVDDERETLIL